MLDLCLNLNLKLDIKGGCSKTIFPIVEEWLEHGDNINVIDIIDNGESNQYWSVMDFLVCKIYPRRKPTCMKYYKGKAKQLKHYVTKKQIDIMQIQMIAILNGLLIIHTNNIKMKSWSKFLNKTFNWIKHNNII